LNTPLVSVVLTVYQPRPYLEKAIESVLGQSSSDLELVVTDDANSDSTRQFCDRYSADRRVRYRSNPTRLGALLNIAAALKEVRGEFVAILNDDDQSEPDLLHALVPPLLRDPGCVLAFGDHSTVDGSGVPVHGFISSTTRLAKQLNLTEGMVPEPFGFALRGGVLMAMGVLFRRCALRQTWFISGAGGAYDLWLAIQLSVVGSLYYVPRPLMRYRVHANSESARVDSEKIQGEIFIFQTLLKWRLSAHDYDYVRNQLAGCLFVLGRERLYAHNRPGARSAFVRSLQVKAGAKSTLGLGSTYLPPKALGFGLRCWRKQPIWKCLIGQALG